MADTMRLIGVAFAFFAFIGETAALRAQDVPAIDWQDGPTLGELGGIAQIRVPSGYRFAGKDGSKRFLELTQNPPSGRELGVIMPAAGPGEEMWFVIFEFNPIGYVKDDERDALDGKAILESIKRGTARGNEERQKRGWSTMEIIGWQTPPRYDAITNNLTWAVRGSTGGDEVINHSVRLLGRKGVMDVDLVLSTNQVSSIVPKFDKMLSGFTFVPGNRYAEFRQGDRIAEYGLTALVAGGAGAVLMKTGLLGKLWKLIVAAVVGLGALVGRVITALRRKQEPAESAGANSGQ